MFQVIKRIKIGQVWYNLKIFKVAKKDGIYQIWDVTNVKDGQKQFIKTLEDKGAINILRESTNKMELMVDGNRKEHLGRLLKSRSITFVVSTDKTPVPYYPSVPPNARRSNQKTRPMSAYSRITYDSKNFRKRVLDWKDFYPLHFINTFMTDLEKEYPSTCTVLSIGKTVEGREIKVLKISNSHAGNTGVWIDGAIHAREWISASVVTYIANHIANNFKSKNSNHITNKDWYFAPVLNPDGYEYSHAFDRMWRKNRSRIGNTIVGVDLNRNFGNKWGYETQMVDPSHLNYPGSQPFSEPECAAVKDIILYSGTPFKIFITFHAYSELISFPWCFTNEPCGDYVALLEGATVMAKAIYETTGRMYKVGNFRDLMYYASGTSIDWSYGVANIPFTYLVELRSKEHKFTPPKDQIIYCCKESLNGVLALAEFVDKKTEDLKRSVIPKKR